MNEWKKRNERWKVSARKPEALALNENNESNYGS